MNHDEYRKLEALDREHWFYEGKRRIVRHWLGRFHRISADDLWIDAGCGTGRLLEEMAPCCRVLGLDSAPESIALSAPKLEPLGGRVLRTDLDRVPLPDGCASVITLLDVLEHLDDDGAALREMIRLTRPGGLIIITVPALRWLWGDWDEALHHRRRYHRPDLVRLLAQPELTTLRCAYFNWLALPPILLVRQWRKLWKARPGRERLEDRLPGRWLNGLLREAMVRPACLARLHPPVGVSLLGIVRRTA